MKRLTLCALLLAATAGAQTDFEPRVRRLEAIEGINVCGNGVLENDFQEACDGTDLAGLTCESFGFDGGVLACGGSCEFDTSGCMNLPPPVPPTPTESPYYATPPGDSIVLRDCGPEREWGVIDIRTDADVEGLRKQIGPETRAVVRVHARPEPYLNIIVKGGRCVKVIGVGGRPLVASVNATKSFRFEVRPGGLIVENIQASAGLVERARPGEGAATVAEGIGVPNDQTFLIIRDTEVSRVGHHGFTTSHAHHLYVEVGRSHFFQASSHLAYINHNAMAWVYDSKFESPGWGHALRCTALRCVLERNQVSNVQLDGAVLPIGGDNPLEPDRFYMGMAPLEIYSCGEHELTDNSVTFYKQQGKTGAHGFAFRWREGMETCDVGEVADGQWTPLPWSAVAPFQDPERWLTVTEQVATVNGQTIQIVGPEVATSFGFDVDGNYPMANDPEKKVLSTWLKSRVFLDWADLVAQAEASGNQFIIYAARQTLPSHQKAFMKGTVTNKVPLWVPETWKQRSRLVLDGVVTNAPVLVIPGDPRGTGQYCLGTPPVGDGCSEQLEGRRYRQAHIEIH